MTPSHALRLQSMLRSMTEVIIPSLDRTQQLALDQAKIIVGNLKILMDQNDKAYLFNMVELREYSALVRDMIAVADGGAASTAAKSGARAVLANAEPVAALQIPTQAALVDQVTAIKEVADALLAAALADGSGEFRQAAQRLVLKQGEQQVTRERSWVRAAGFEMDASKLPSIEETLVP